MSPGIAPCNWFILLPSFYETELQIALLLVLFL